MSKPADDLERFRILSRSFKSRLSFNMDFFKFLTRVDVDLARVGFLVGCSLVSLVGSTVSGTKRHLAGVVSKLPAHNTMGRGMDGGAVNGKFISCARILSEVNEFLSFM